MPLIKVKANQVKVRMYRIGHGDCFLISLPQDSGKPPYFILIDCGYKPGSQKFLHHTDVKEIVDHIHESTGGRIDLFIITHEHQDHCNGIVQKTKSYFDHFTIANAWFAWTEDPTDELANKLRKRHRDTLLALESAYSKLALALGDSNPSVKSLFGLLELESGENGASLLAATDPENSDNKRAMKFVKDKVRESGGKDRIEFLNPGDTRQLPDGPPLKAYVLGPPRNPELLADEDPHGSEGFRRLSFSAAARSNRDFSNHKPANHEPEKTSTSAGGTSPFSRQHGISEAEAKSDPWFMKYYGFEKGFGEVANNTEVSEAADWRRINEDWLFAAENLAMKLNSGINNTSLVLAFELPRSKKVLLFIGDAQRGNWLSWADQSWTENEKNLTTRDLLARTVLYKVGHHGSHNATLDGTIDDDYANLTWMGQGRHAKEFTAMITAVKEWAMTKNDPPWVHPLPSIRNELLAKTSGRTFQTDKEAPIKPDNVSQTDWDAFMKRVVCEKLYFELTIADPKD